MIEAIFYNREPATKAINVIVGFAVGVMVTLAIMDFL